MTTQTDVQVHNLSKHYFNGQCAIRQLSFTVAQGEFLAIVGPSGAGKTSLLKILAGLDQHHQGEVRNPQPDHTSLMFQEPRLMPWLTVAQNLQLVAPDASADHIAQLLREVGLEGYAQHFPKQLSGGMQRRAALARAFIRRPRLLLMDEPFQSLDAPSAAQLQHHLMQLWRSHGCTVVLVTHQLSEAVALADRILFLSKGPSRLLLDWKVDLPRPRSTTSATVQSACEHLLARHPQLLEGHVAPEHAPLACEPVV